MMSRANQNWPDDMTVNVDTTEEQLNLAAFSDQGLVALSKIGRLDYVDFVKEIKRRVDAGEYVHPYHAKCIGTVRLPDEA